MTDPSLHDHGQGSVDEETSVQLNAATVEVVLPKFINWEMRNAYDYEEQIVDYSSLEELGAAITKARKSLFVLTDKINQYERRERAAKLNYERAYRRTYLESMGRTEAEKKMRAALKHEELENEWIRYEQVREELVRLSFSLKTELQTLQTIANNLRQQLRVY